MIHNSVVIVTGPTASGKTDLAIKLAKKFNGELISADSRQVYKFLDIGTAKDKSFPHHLIDVVDPRFEKMTVADYQKQVYKLIDEIHNRNKLPIIVGGTGLYIDAILKGYDFPKHKKFRGQFMGHASPPPFKFLIIGIDWPRQKLYERITRRTRQMLNAGLVNETRKLVELLPKDHELLKTLGYKQILENHTELEQTITAATKIFVRHQYNWFKRWPVRWIDPSALALADGLVAEFLAN